jgi:circadian clock protein KaiC
MQRFFSSPRRLSAFLVALTNELRALGTTVILAAEIDAYVDHRLVVPVQSASATMDNAVLLRHIELASEMRRLVCVLKAYQTGTEYGIRELDIGEDGLSVSEPFPSVTRLLTGHAMPTVSPETGSIF